MEARQHRLPRRHFVHAPVAHVADQNLARRFPDAHAGRVEPDANISVGVEPAIVEWRLDDVFHRLAGGNARDQRTHEKTRKRGVAVREMINVGLFPGRVLVLR